ncbi:hypothetical protein C2S52_018573 [Perilla frutescens var. hirtella]|nr:hypothetical protein C2S52_018573 [Perilla frutescens var. hirtella]
MDDYYHCDRNTKFDIIGEFDNSDSHEFKIKLNFYFKEDISNWILHQDSTTPQLTQVNPTSNCLAASLIVTVRGFLSRDSLREAAGKTIGDGLLHNHEIDQLINLAWKEVLKVCKTTGTLPTSGVLRLACMIFITHRHIYGVESDDCHRMVPAAESSFKLLEEYEVVDEESCCSVCLEEMGGGAALRMPCSHVFHGGCIQKWLRRSHYCPLCRYKMPTEE